MIEVLETGLAGFITLFKPMSFHASQSQSVQNDVYHGSVSINETVTRGTSIQTSILIPFEDGSFGEICLLLQDPESSYLEDFSGAD